MRTVVIGTMVVAVIFVVTTIGWGWTEALGICLASAGGVLVGRWARR